MTVKLGMTHAQLINAINSDIDLIKGQGSKIITKEFPASETETSSVQLDTKCQGKDYMFVFMDYGILEPSKYSLSADGLTVSFSPAIPANHKIIIRYFTPGSSFTNYVTDEFQSNLLNYTTNRILEIPQDIKLELNNGTLTLKAGSKVYVPNGFKADGTTPKFDVVTIENDIVSQNFNRSGTNFIRYESGVLFCDWPVSDFSSSSNTSSVTGWYYDTSKNEIKYYNSGVAKNHTVGFPLGVATVSNNIVNSLDQIFNGFGYIGSTLFLLPGVKTVVPDGRNDDGTCKNKAPSTVTSVKTETISRADTAYMFTNYASSVIAIHHYICSKTKPTVPTTTLWYNPETNLPSQVLSDGTVLTPYWEIPLAKFTSDSTGKITSFTPYTVDSVVNSNASNFSQAGRSYLSGLGMPSGRYIDLTLGASGTLYTAPANGWFSLDTWTTSTATAYYQLHNRTSGLALLAVPDQGHVYQQKGFIPCKAGDIVTFIYANIDTTKTSWRFIYAQGEQ